MDFSKDYKIKMKVKALMEETGLSEKQIISSILNNYSDPEKSGPEFLNEFIKKGDTKFTLEDIFPKK